MTTQQVQYLQQQLNTYGANINALRNEIATNPHSANHEILKQYETAYVQIQQQLQQLQNQQMYNPQQQLQSQQPQSFSMGNMHTTQPTNPFGSGTVSKYAMYQDTQPEVKKQVTPNADTYAVNTAPTQDADIIPLFGEDYEPLARYPSTKEILGNKYRWLLCGPPDDTTYPEPIKIEGEDIIDIDLIALTNYSSSDLKGYIYVIEDGNIGVCDVDVIEVIHTTNPTLYKSLSALIATDISRYKIDYDNDNVNLSITAHFNSYLRLGCFGYHTIENIGDISDLLDLTDSDDKPTDYIGTVRDIIPSLSLTIERDKDYIDNIHITQEATMVLCRNEDMSSLLETITTEPKSLTLKSNRGLYELLMSATNNFKDKTILFIVTPQRNYKGVYNSYTKIICIERIS